MVLGLIAAVGVGLAGYGIFKGSTDAGRAAERAGRAVERTGRGAEVTLQTISQEIKQMRVFFTETAWPEVNKTLVHFRGTLDHANVFP